MPEIESLLSARLFVAPQLAGQRLYFVANLSGRLSLYAMDRGGSVPEPLLPPSIAVQNPKLMNGYVFYVFPRLGKILVMLDRDGDENYQPMVIPIDGGIPEPAFGDRFAGYRVHLTECDPNRNIVYLSAESRREQVTETYQADLASGSVVKIDESRWFPTIDAANADHSRAVLIEGYTVGDHVVYLWDRETGRRRLLYGMPLEERRGGQHVPLNSIYDCSFTESERGLLCITTLFDDAYGPGYLPLDGSREMKPVTVSGIRHSGAGVMDHLDRLQANRYQVEYNIDGCSWLYEGTFDETMLHLHLDTVLCGEGTLRDGVLEDVYYDRAGDRYALSFSTATSPTQLYTIDDPARQHMTQHTRERVLGIPAELLSPGEDASYTSFDGLRISARLYLPAPALGFEGPRPLVYYIHGGPQGQERPDFAWFSMPMIQFLTLNGFAVFVPNVRGSTGYGLAYTKKVDRDWGGDDRLDHVYAMEHVLPHDERIDTTRAGVMGRSYGGYMTLTLAARHPQLWRAAVDMFGPYDLLTFMQRIPETWKPYFSIAVGDPVLDRDFLIERSPSTYIDAIACPLLVIQGRNDPRVIEQESRDVVERLRLQGKQVDYLVFDDEGHDVLKFDNRVRCYTQITAFFVEHLRP